MINKRSSFVCLAGAIKESLWRDLESDTNGSLATSSIQLQNSKTWS